MRVLHVLHDSVPVVSGDTSRSRYIVLNQKAPGMEPVVLTSPRMENPGRIERDEIDGIRHYRTLSAPRVGLLGRKGA